MAVLVRRPPRSPSSDILADENLFATTAVVIVADSFGLDAFSWEPAALLMELEETFAVDIPRANFDRLMAGIQLITTDEFYRSVPTFVDICNALAGQIVDPNLWDPADASEIAWAMTEAAILDPQDAESPPWDADVISYITQALIRDGLVSVPIGLKHLVKPDKLPSHNVLADDPISYAATYSFELDKVREIDRAVAVRFLELERQLESLQLSNGRAAGALTALVNAGQ